jgi:hypothetical protein
MKSLSQLMLLTAFVVLGACAKGGDSGGGDTTAAVPAPNTCAAGSVYTAQGQCYPQGSCPVNYGWNGSTCVVGTMGGAGQCGVGSVSTAQGCLAQGSCPVNYGWNGSTCVIGNAMGYNGGYQQGYPGYNTGYNTGYYNGGYQQGYNYNTGYNTGYYGGGYQQQGYYPSYYQPSAGFYIGGRIGFGY